MPNDLAALRALLTSRAAADKPATWEADDDHVYEVFPQPDGEPFYGLVASCLAEEDASLIAAAINALPALLDRLAAASEVVEAVRDVERHLLTMGMPPNKLDRGLIDALASYDRAIAGQQQRRQEGTTDA